jgi:probable F420-dependent oxidoreductase
MQYRPGVIFFTDALEASALEAFALRLEELGYESLWIPEFAGREPFTTASFVLARTSRLKVATGIANVYARDAIVTAQARQALAELSGGRFVLGLGVSHPPMAELHGLEWLPPVRKMREYLDVMEQTRVQAPQPETPAPLWLSAHAPGLLRLAAARADGANTYLMPPAHTEKARELVGPELRLNVVAPCCLCDDPAQARRIGRKALAIYLPLPAYRRQWLQWGFAESDFADGGSDHLVDSLVAWGDETKIRERLAEHVAAGASQIEVSALHPEGGRPRPHWELLEALAPG